MLRKEDAPKKLARFCSAQQFEDSCSEMVFILETGLCKMAFFKIANGSGHLAKVTLLIVVKISSWSILGSKLISTLTLEKKKVSPVSTLRENKETFQLLITAFDKQNHYIHTVLAIGNIWIDIFGMSFLI